MLKLFRNRKAQSIAEYAIVIAVVIGVATAMQVYVKRSVQGRIAGASDNFITKVKSTSTDWDKISDAKALTDPSPQWEPDLLSSRTTRDVVKDDVTETLTTGGGVTRTIDRHTRQGGDGDAVGHTEGTADYQLYDYTK